MYIRARSSIFGVMSTPTAFQYFWIIGPALVHSVPVLEISRVKASGLPSGIRRMPLASFLGSALSRNSLAFLTSNSVYCLASFSLS